MTTSFFFNWESRFQGSLPEKSLSKSQTPSAVLRGHEGEGFSQKKFTRIVRGTVS